MLEDLSFDTITRQSGVYALATSFCLAANPLPRRSILVSTVRGQCSLLTAIGVARVSGGAEILNQTSTRI